jgi:hypothetical protein
MKINEQYCYFFNNVNIFTIFSWLLNFTPIILQPNSILLYYRIIKRNMRKNDTNQIHIRTYQIA